jgi:hypothetical protein
MEVISGTVQITDVASDKYEEPTSIDMRGIIGLK